jgi:ABC-type phosphate transport system auxiliary subunit
MASASQDRAETHFRHGPPHIAVQILGLLLFGGFAIVATILAMVTFWPAGVALAMVLAWIGFGPILNQHHPRPGLDWVKQVVPQNQVNRTGNTSFDAYRAEVLDRLEDEQKTFVSFLDRLRDAKDKAQFDSFTDDRARANRDAEAEDEDKRNDARRGEY